MPRIVRALKKEHSKGRYTLQSLQPGDYVVWVTKEGFAVSAQAVQLRNGDNRDRDPIMRTWVKATLGGVALIAVAIAALAATGAYFVLRHMEKRAASEGQALQAIGVVKARFGSRPPLVEIIDPQRADIRQSVGRSQRVAGRHDPRHQLEE